MYQGIFADINDNVYRVQIGTGNATEITLLATPFTVEYETSDDNMFKPYKCSTATVGVLASDYMFDLYSSTPHQNPVKLLDSSDNVLWTGYLTPNLYDVGYTRVKEELQLEAIDALSTLQYFDYEPLGQNKDIVCILDIVKSLLTKAGGYTDFYVSHCIRRNTNVCLMSETYISEENFFDEDGKPTKMLDVLFYICQYFNLTCIAEGTKVYFLDYTAIKAGVTSYYHYVIGSNTSTLDTVYHTHAITAADYAGPGSELSLGNTYNSVKVVDSLYSFDSVIPSIWDTACLTNWQGNNTIQTVNEEFKGDKYKCFFKYYKNSNYRSYYYTKANLTPTTLSSMNYNQTCTYVGATIVRHKSEKVDDYNKLYNDIDFTDYVLLHVHDTAELVYTVDGNKAIISDTPNIKPLFQLVINDDKASFIGGNTYFIVQGNFLWLDREGEMYRIEGYANKDDDFNPDNLWITCQFTVGGKYWNGSSWQTTACTFRLPLDNNNQVDHCINQSFPVKNNISYTMGIDGEGYAIPAPTGSLLTGKPTFTIYQPHRIAIAYRCDAVWISNLDVIAKVQNFSEDDSNSSDTEYGNVIDEEFVAELDNVENHICTWDNKECNYSAVAYKSGNDYYFLDGVTSAASLLSLREEQHTIYNLVTQYSTPSAILSVNLKTGTLKPFSYVTDAHLSGKVFIVDSVSIDWRLQSSMYRLIEKQ